MSDENNTPEINIELKAGRARILCYHLDREALDDLRNLIDGLLDVMIAPQPKETGDE